MLTTKRLERLVKIGLAGIVLSSSFSAVIICMLTKVLRKIDQA